MNPNRRINALLGRINGGKVASVLKQTQVGTDELNSPVYEWSADYEVKCVRTYPNRNTQVESPGGAYNRDSPTFLFERSEAPEGGQRIRFDGQLYELESPTLYHTHAAIIGEQVSE